MTAGSLKVVGVAIRDADGTCYALGPPLRHHDVIALMWEQHDRPHQPEDVQGFLLSDGSFADRYTAKEIAVASGQQIPRHMNLPQLYSEDVW